MRLFVYEFVTGGGFLGGGWGWPPESLLREGAAMARAVRADLAAIGTETVGVLDDRLGETSMAADGPQSERSTEYPIRRTQYSRFDAAERGEMPRLWQGSRRRNAAFQRPSPAGAGFPGPGDRAVRSADEERAAIEELAAACDATMVIAPEFDHALLKRCRWVEAAGGRLLGPGPDVVQLASDKQATIERLAAFGLPTPDGSIVEPGRGIPRGIDYPAVGKPLLGAGSQGVRLLADRAAAEAWWAGLSGPGRLERFCPGLAASVAVLCGPAGVFPLLPCRQRLSGDGRFVYQGGSLPLEAPLAHRAADLAARCVAALPGAMGYLGVDLVLGADHDGRDDVVIEINPRLTTSYVGLRAAVADDSNLAAAIVAEGEGRRPRLSFRGVEVQCEAVGRCGEIGVGNQEFEVGSP